MVIRMRHTRSHTRNRRSHHALKTINLATCEKCNTRTLPHRACVNCGFYRGRIAVDVAAHAAKKLAKKKEAGKETKEHDHAEDKKS